MSSHVQLRVRGLVEWRSTKICTQGYRPQVYEWVVNWGNSWEEQPPSYGLWSKDSSSVVKREQMLENSSVFHDQLLQTYKISEGVN